MLHMQTLMVSCIQSAPIPTEAHEMFFVSATALQGGLVLCCNLTAAFHYIKCTIW